MSGIQSIARHRFAISVTLTFFVYLNRFTSYLRFYSLKIGPEVVLAARWRRKEKITSPFDSPTPTLYRLSVEIFRLSLTVQKLFDCIYLAGNLAFRFQNLGLSGDFDP